MIHGISNRIRNKRSWMGGRRTAPPLLCAASPPRQRRRSPWSPSALRCSKGLTAGQAVPPMTCSKGSRATTPIRRRQLLRRELLRCQLLHPSPERLRLRRSPEIPCFPTALLGRLRLRRPAGPASAGSWSRSSRSRARRPVPGSRRAPSSARVWTVHGGECTAAPMAWLVSLLLSLSLLAESCRPGPS